MGDYFDIVWLTASRAFVVGNMAGQEVLRELKSSERELVLGLNERFECEGQKLFRSFAEQALPWVWPRQSAQSFWDAGNGMFNNHGSVNA